MAEVGDLDGAGWARHLQGAWRRAAGPDPRGRGSGGGGRANHGGRSGDGGGCAGYCRGFPRNLEEGETLAETHFSKPRSAVELAAQLPTPVAESLPLAPGIQCLVLPLCPSSDRPGVGVPGSASLIDVSRVGPGLLKVEAACLIRARSPSSDWDTWKGRNVNILLSGQQWNKIGYVH